MAGPELKKSLQPDGSTFAMSSHSLFARPLLPPRPNTTYGTVPFLHVDHSKRNLLASDRPSLLDAASTPGHAATPPPARRVPSEVENGDSFDDTKPMKPEAFYKMIDVRPPHGDEFIASLADLEAGNGLFHNIRAAHEATERAHYWFEVGIYCAILGQVLRSANFIILGAMRGDHHVPISILGAFSVSIAGCPALVKGQGLPMRLRIQRDSLWEVQLETEELHWSMAAGKPVMFNDVKRIWERFVQVKRDASLNHPDTWNASASAANGAIGAPAKPAQLTSTRGNKGATADVSASTEAVQQAAASLDGSAG